MWSCQLSKIKKSIANSLPDAETYRNTPDVRQTHAQSSYFFTKTSRWQHLFELFIAGNILALVLALAEAQSWQHLSGIRLFQYMAYISWVLLSFAAITDAFSGVFRRWTYSAVLVAGFTILQVVVVLTTMSLNGLLAFGRSFSWTSLSAADWLDGVVLHLSYGLLLGAFCLRYLYMQEQWLRQQQSELQARIQAMQARIHPHFLFNSLNSVVSLIAINPDKAEAMLINLSRLFRASFQELKLVSLAEEIRLCQHYLEIEQIRLGDRLSVNWKIPEPQDLQRIQIPLLTLQPLLENSILHGVEKTINSSNISVLIEIVENKVNIVVTNPYSTEKTKRHQGHGIALDNIRQRLKAYYGDSVQFQTYAGQALFTTVLQYQYQ